MLKLSFAPGLAVAGLTATVSMAAAMGGVQALAPASHHAPAAAAAVAAPPSPPPAAAQAAAHLATAHDAPADAPSTQGAVASATTATTTTATNGNSSNVCTPSELPSQANGVGRRCTTGPPASVPGNGKANGSGHLPAATPNAAASANSTPHGQTSASPTPNGNSANPGNRASHGG